MILQGVLNGFSMICLGFDRNLLHGSSHISW